MTDHPFTHTDPISDDLAQGAIWLLDLIAAVDHLRRGFRPDLTTWDALSEALHWHLELDPTDAPPGGLDVFGDALARLARRQVPTAPQLQAAIRHWVTTMANRYNNGYQWPHPAPRRGFPPPLVIEP